MCGGGGDYCCRKAGNVCFLFAQQETQAIHSTCPHTSPQLLLHREHCLAPRQTAPWQGPTCCQPNKAMLLSYISKSNCITEWPLHCCTIAVCVAARSAHTLSSIVMRPSGVLLSREMSKNTNGLACGRRGTAPAASHCNQLWNYSVTFQMISAFRK